LLNLRSSRFDPVDVLRRNRTLLKIALLANGLAVAGALASAVRAGSRGCRVFYVLTSMVLAAEWFGTLWLVAQGHSQSTAHSQLLIDGIPNGGARIEL
jgi:hypothetical protein